MSGLVYRCRPIRTRDTVPSPGGWLIVQALAYSRDTTPEDAIAGRGSVVEFTATSDGRGYLPEVHTGPDADVGEWIYVERHVLQDGREIVSFHGWIDSITRKILQTG